MTTERSVAARFVGCWGSKANSGRLDINPVLNASCQAVGKDLLIRKHYLYIHCLKAFIATYLCSFNMCKLTTFNLIGILNPNCLSDPYLLLVLRERRYYRDFVTFVTFVTFKFFFASQDNYQVSFVFSFLSCLSFCKRAAHSGITW